MTPSNALSFLLAQYRRWLFESWRMPASHLVAFRMCACLFILYNGNFAVSELRHVPDEVFFPPLGPLQLLPSYPPHGLLIAVSWLGMAATAMLMLGKRPLATGALATTCGVFLAGVSFSVGGKIDHSILLVISPLLIGFASNEASSSETGESAWPFAVLALSVGVALFSSGFVKFASGWLALEDSSVYGYLLRNYYVHERGQLVGSVAVAFDVRAFWELLDYATVLFEASFIVGALFPKVMRWVVPLMSLMHVGIMLLLGINFSHNMVVYAGLLLWPAAWLAPFQKLQDQLERWSLLQVSVASGLLASLLLSVDAPRSLLGQFFGTWLVGTVQITLLTAIVLTTLRPMLPPRRNAVAR